MKKSILFSVIVCLFSLGYKLPAHAQNYLNLAGLSPSTQYLTFDTEHFHLTYPRGYLEFAQKAAGHLEHAHEVLSPILKWQPRSRTDILIVDNEDDANGFTSPALRIGIVLNATPPDVYFSTAYTDDWIKLLAFHEYTHFLNIDPTTSWMEALRIYFGDIIRPNGVWPVWMLEGLAVYFETRTSKLGRGRSPYYDAIVRAYLDEGRLGTRENRGLTLDRVNGNYPYFPGGEIPYLFGYHLWNQFSQDHLVNADTDAAMGELSLRSSARVPYFIEGNLENVMKKNWQDYWDDFIKESQTRLGAQIKSIRTAGESQYQWITKSHYAALLGALSPNGDWLAYSESKLDDRTRLVLKNLKTGEERRLDEKTLGLGMDFTQDSRYLIYSSLRRFKTYQSFSELMVYDFKTGNSRQLTEGLRAKDPSLSPDGKHITFITSELATHHLKIADLQISEKGISLSHIRDAAKISAFSMIGTPRFTQNDQIVYSLQELGESHADLMLASVQNASARVLFANGKINRFPVSRDNKIYFTSDLSGIDNIFSVDTAGKNLTQLTNVVTAANYPAVSASGNLWASVLTSDGFEIAKFTDSLSQEAARLKNIKFIQASASAPETLPSAMTEPSFKIDPSNVKDYSAWLSLLPRQWAPVSYLTYGSRAGLSLGGILLGFDTTGKHQYFALGGYNFKAQTLDGTFQYTYSGFRPILDFTALTNTTDIASDFDSTQYRKSSEVSLALSYPIRWTYSSLTPRIYGFTSWNRVYDLYSHQAVSIDDYEYSKPMIPGLGASLSFSDVETSRLGFMPEEGNEVSLAAEDRINPGNFSVIKYLASYRHYFDLREHFVLLPRLKFLGSTFPTGFDRSYARLQGRDSQNIGDRGGTLNLNRMGIRGYTDRILFARQVAVSSIDFHFPIANLFSGNDTFPSFNRQLHGFIFGETAFIPSSRLHNFYLPSFGGGVSLDTLLFIRAPVRFTLEVQNGTRKDYGGDTQVFLSIEGGSLF